MTTKTPQNEAAPLATSKLTSEVVNSSFTAADSSEQSVSSDQQAVNSGWQSEDPVDSDADSSERLWRFEENNEWEGERWRVFFYASEEAGSKVEALAAVLSAEKDSPYELRRITKLPAKIASKGSKSSGYYPRNQVGKLREELLEDAIQHWSAENCLEADDDPLYKLGLFEF